MNIISQLENMPASGKISEMSEKYVKSFHLIEDAIKNDICTPFNAFWMYPSACLIMLPKISSSHILSKGEGFLKPIAISSGLTGDKILSVAYSFASVGTGPAMQISFEDAENLIDLPWFIPDDEWIDSTIRLGVTNEPTYWCLVAYDTVNNTASPKYYTGYYDQGFPKVSSSFDKALRLTRKEDAEALKRNLPKAAFNYGPWKVEDHVYYGTLTP